MHLTQKRMCCTLVLRILEIFLVVFAMLLSLPFLHQLKNSFKVRNAGTRPSCNLMFEKEDKKDMSIVRLRRTHCSIIIQADIAMEFTCLFICCVKTASIGFTTVQSWQCNMATHRVLYGMKKCSKKFVTIFEIWK